ncbi:MAG: aspartate/glutamate racemase family protein [Bacteroidota bacterium]
MKKLALVHTIPWFDRTITKPLVEPWLAKHPELEVVNIMDDSLLTESQPHGGPTKAVIKRLIYYFQAAEATGADVIMSTCSSMGIGTRIGREFVNIPLFNIDEPMAKEAMSLGRVFGVVATVPTSLPATVSLLKREALDAEKSVEIKELHCQGAFDALGRGDKATHDLLVREALQQLENEVDVLILGQVSLSQVHFEGRVPLLQVGASGFAHAEKLLNLQELASDRS